MSTSLRAQRLLPFVLLPLSACATERFHTLTLLEATPLVTNTRAGDVAPVHDPSIIRQNETYYLFSSDPVNPRPHQYLPIRCSNDTVVWRPCGQVFTAIPAWVTAAVPGILTLWAPDVSYFNGQYHVYFAASLPGSQA